MATNKFESKKKKVNESEIENFINKKATNKGRKSIDEDKKKTKIVTLYFTESDYLLIKEIADKRRLSIGQYIVSKIFE